MYINGTYNILSIKWQGDYLPVGCLSGSDFNENIDTIPTTTRDNNTWKSYRTTNQGYSINFSGLIINTLFLGGDDTKISLDKLKVLKRSGELIDWKIETKDLVFIDSGQGYLTDIGDSVSIDNFITFSATILGDGQPTSTSSGITPFIINVKTNNSGSTNNNQYKLTINKETNILGQRIYSYDYFVLTSDGQFFSNVTDDLIITFETTGVYELKIYGVFPAIRQYENEDSSKIIDIIQWGDNNWKDMRDAFLGCNNLIGTFTDFPDLSNVFSVAGAFKDCSLFNGDVKNWNVSNIQNFFAMFQNAVSFNQLLNWNLQAGTNFSRFLKGCSSFNQEVSQLLLLNNALAFDFMDGNSSFNKSLADFNISNISNLSNSFNNIPFSLQNSDETWVGWGSRALPNLKNIGMSLANYTIGSQAEIQRQRFIEEKGIHIFDSGGVSLSSDIYIRCRFESPGTGTIKILNGEPNEIINVIVSLQSTNSFVDNNFVGDIILQTPASIPNINTSTPSVNGTVTLDSNGEANINVANTISTSVNSYKAELNMEITSRSSGLTDYFEQNWYWGLKN